MHVVSGAVLEKWNLLNDLQVVARVVAGQTALFEVLVRRYTERVYRAVRATTDDESRAEHLVQQAFLDAYANMRQFDGRTTFAIWLTRIAVNTATRTLLTGATVRRGWAAPSSSRAGTAVT